MVAPLSGPDFQVWRQVRTGLLSYPLESSAARAHLSASIYLQMALRPHIVHIVGHTEADHAADANEIIEASNMARRAIENALRGMPNMRADPAIQERVEELVHEARVTLKAVEGLAIDPDTDPFIEPATLARAVTCGILDAPQLKNNPYAQGKMMTAIDHRGACIAIDPQRGNPISEVERIQSLKIGEDASLEIDLSG
ncbi:MAG: hypothetical protein A2Z14_13155 [Chloroflexi bacterium RBG_16_48_8]|nr:MAG: hypothetical protein A2Z14_13155 [Chloroflexi bacterium RBG_16_48_8]